MGSVQKLRSYPSFGSFHRSQYPVHEQVLLILYLQGTSNCLLLPVSSRHWSSPNHHSLLLIQLQWLLTYFPAATQPLPPTLKAIPQTKPNQLMSVLSFSSFDLLMTSSSTEKTFKLLPLPWTPHEIWLLPTCWTPQLISGSCHPHQPSLALGTFLEHSKLFPTSGALHLLFCSPLCLLARLLLILYASYWI